MAIQLSAEVCRAARNKQSFKLVRRVTDGYAEHSRCLICIASICSCGEESALMKNETHGVISRSRWMSISIGTRTNYILKV